MDIRKYIIGKERTLLDALAVINEIGNLPLTLLVVDEEDRMVGTVTDGDIRRALVKGLSLDAKVKDAIHADFKFVREGDKDFVENLRAFRQKFIRLVPVLDTENHIIDIINLAKTVTKLPVDAVLMAGGKGERLRPLTEKTPKPLLPVGDKTIIDYNVDRLISYGVEHISVTVNYLKEQLQEHFKAPRKGVQVQCVTEPKCLGTIGSVRFVETFYHDTVLVMNSDLFTNLNYEDFYLDFYQQNADMSVAAVPYSIAIPYGIMELEGNALKGMIEKPTYNYYANAGIYLIKREMLDLIPENEFFNATDFVEKLIKLNKKVVRFPINGTWIDIGTPQEYQKAKDLIRHIV